MKKSSQKFYLGFSKPLDIDHYNEEIFFYYFWKPIKKVMYYYKREISDCGIRSEDMGDRTFRAWLMGLHLVKSSTNRPLISTWQFS